MKKLAAAMIGIASLLSGCAGYIDPYPDTHSNTNAPRDRDGDGVPDRNDRRPDDPRFK